MNMELPALNSFSPWLRAKKLFASLHETFRQRKMPAKCRHQYDNFREMFKVEKRQFKSPLQWDRKITFHPGQSPALLQSFR